MSSTDSRNTGEDLEREVARVYSLLGAQTQRRLLVDHYEIDVHAVMRRGPFTLSFVVECKEYGAGQAVSDTEMEKFVVKLTAARQRGMADKGVFVTTSEFSKNARATAARHGIQCLFLRDLQNQLVDFQPYLKHTIHEFDSSNLGRWYVDQTVSEFEDYEALGTEAKRLALHSPALEHIERLFTSSSERRLALLGNFGTGKSSFCLAYRAHLARAALSNSTARIPLLIDLREFRSGLDIEQIIVNTLQRLPGVDIAMPVCMELQRLGRFFFLLDGLDEMATRVDRTVINEGLQEIDRLRVSGNNRYILTCRTHFFQERILEDFLSDYNVLYLTEWSRLQIEGYFNKRFGSDGPHKCEQTLANPKLAELARTPLLLDILLETGDLEDDHINVYTLLSRYTDGWIVKQSKRRGTVMTTLQRKRFVETLAIHMYVKGVHQLHFSELYEVAREFCGHRDASRIDHFDADARTCTFITRDAGGNYGFRYEAFFDYFSARAIAERIEARDSTALDTRELRSEIIDLIVGRTLGHQALDQLHAWAADFSAQRRSANAVRILNGLRESLSVEVQCHYGVSRHDRELLSGSPETDFNALFIHILKNYVPLLRKEARRLKWRYPEVKVDEVVHEVLARLWISAQEKSFTMTSFVNIKDYLRAMLRNTLADNNRALERSKLVFVGDVREWAEYFGRLVDPDEERGSEASALLSKIEDVVGELSEREHEILRLRIEGWTNKEIGKELGIQIDAVTVLASAIRRRLRRRLGAKQQKSFDQRAGGS